MPIRVFSLVGGRYTIQWDHVMAATLLATVPVGVGEVTPRWRFRTIDSVCEAGYAVNDDVGTALDHAAWVLDGTTGHHPVRLFPGPSDAAWFAATVDDLLRGLADTPDDGRALLQRLVSELTKACRRSALTPLDDGEVDEPAASLALARVDGDRLEIIMLGDCTLLLQRRDGAVEALDRSKVGPSMPRSSMPCAPCRPPARRIPPGSRRDCAR